MRLSCWAWSVVVACGLAWGGPARAGGAGVADAVVTRVPGEAAVRVDGHIGPRFVADLEAALAAQPSTRVVLVRSQGGRLEQARRAAALLNARGITVRIDGHCASACAVLWAAADSREMMINARLGLHRSRWPVSLPGAIRRWAEARSDRENARVLRSAGFSRRLIRRGWLTPASQMHWVEALELKRERVPFVLRDRYSVQTRG